MGKVFIALVVFLLPTAVVGVYPEIARAAEFAKETLFLSKSSVTEGETVLIHAVVSNAATTKFVGQMQINDGEATVGTVPVSLAAGEATAVSVSWKPSAGSHTITAQLRDSSGAVVEKESQTFSIAPKAAPVDAFAAKPAAATTTVGSSEDIQKKIADISPTAARVAEPVFSTVDSVRGTAADLLNNGVDWSKRQIGNAALKTQGSVLGIQASTTSTSGVKNTLQTLLATATLYVFSILLYLVSSAGIFYPLFAILFLLLLWKLFRKFRRRR